METPRDSSLRCDLHGKIAFVTGASGGLGRHFAKVLSEAGAHVIIGARRIEELRNLADAIENKGGRAFTVHLDIQDHASVQRAVATATNACGPIDILVNNSGVTAIGNVLEHSVAQWDAVMNTNLRGTFLMSTEVARLMRTAGTAGAIINIASILGIRQAGQVAAYAVSKAGVVQLTQIMALELARYNIRVNALAPGYLQTPLNQAFCESPAGDALMKRIPQRRFGRLQDLDGPLLLLASDGSQFMTGSVVAVDGGHLISTL